MRNMMYEQSCFAGPSRLWIRVRVRLGGSLALPRVHGRALGRVREGEPPGEPHWIRVRESEPLPAPSVARQTGPGESFLVLDKGSKMALSRL
jgi:hypothetical protein